ncbi:MAG: adenine deaminase [Desulfobulbaceae bacterium]|nr:adenine deaminase [Desulfobulbaceae bacterium]
MDTAAGSSAGNVVQVLDKRIFWGRVSWAGGVITEVEALGAEEPGQPYLIPGFIDAHVHIESAMLPPAEFGRQAVRHGMVAAVADPHEIANVLGADGVRFMVASARCSPFKTFFGVPSCVPATPFETAGAALDLAEMESLLQEPEVRHLAEMMNFPGVLAGDAQVLAKIELARRLGRPVDGHAPGLRGGEAARYAAAGITTDHECFTLAEALDKLACGMHILVREGSAARNFAALHSLITTHTDQVMLCCDDKHPDDLAAGYIDRLAARAVALGHHPLAVLRCACANPVLHYHLPVGLLRLGDAMDAALVADLRDFRVLKVWLDGNLAAAEGRTLLPKVGVAPVNNFRARPITAADLQLPAGKGPLPVIEAMDGELITRELLLEPRRAGGVPVPDTERDILLLCVVNRYEEAPPALAMIRGFGLQKGALASSVAHDSHNVIGVGADAHSLCRAVNAVIEAKGGIAVTDARGVELLPLPIAGLMSDDDGQEVGRRYAELDRLAHGLGSGLRAPFMTLSFMALLVIPELKLSDRGLFDGRYFRFVDARQ